jgi:hypothetical protein
MCRYLVKREQHLFEEIFVISTTEDCNKFYETFIDKRNIFSEFSTEWLDAFYKKAVDSAKEGKNKNILLILDDACSEAEFKKNTVIKQLFIKSRHYKISVIVLSQYLYQIPPICRGNSDFLLAGQMNRKSIDILSDEFQLGNIEKKDFVKLYNKCSSNHGFMLINNNSVENVDDINQIYGKIRVPVEYIH